MSEWRTNRRTKKPFRSRAKDEDVERAKEFIESEMERIRGILGTKPVPRPAPVPVETVHTSEGEIIIPTGDKNPYRPYSYRDYIPGDFVILYRECKGDHDCEANIRARFQHMESGRIGSIAEATHKFLAALDADELELWKKRNPELLRIVNEYAILEDLRVF